jgi:crotonobetainyl-CoA:carnitine CoA-transferase CaiB-like acyl-CoA transferase
MLDVMLAMNTYRVPLALTFAQEPKPAPFEGGQGTVPFGNFECSDGWLALGVSQRAWRSACAVLGRPELADDERFATARARHTHNGALVEILQTTLKGRNADEWQADFLSAGVVAGKVTSIADVFDHPQVRARGMAAGLSDESGRTATVAGDPLKLSDPARWRAPSHTGADTAAVLSSLLGLRAHIIDGLADRGVVYRPRRPDGTLTTSDYTPQPCGRVTESDVGAHDRALSGVVVLELSGDEPSKAFAAQVLADLGARVIRVEPPAAEISEPYPDDDRRSAFRSGLGRGKESVAADLKSPEGRDLYRALVEHADVVLDNYRPGVLQRLQIDQDWLHTVNPTAISCSITGYGHSGPWRSYPAFDNAVQALGGGMSITADHTAPQTPVRWGNPIGGLTGSLYAALGILGAIRVRNRIGATRRIDLSLLDAQVALLSYRVPQAVTLGRKFVPEPRRGGSGSLPFGVFKTADHRWFVLGITAQFWGEFCRVAGCPEAEFDPRFTTEAQRRGHERQLNAMIEGQMLTRTAGEWERLFFDHRLPGATVVTLSEAFNHPQAVERAMRLTVPDELHTTGVDAANLPIKFSATAPPRPAPGPLPGADTARIALEVGLGQPNRAAGGRVDAPP